MIKGNISYQGGSIGIVVGRFNAEITTNLLKGAHAALKKYNVPSDSVTVVEVPGAFEIPLTTAKLFDKGVDVVITLGVVIEGDTDHYTYVCKEAADGIMDVSLEYKKPVIFEVLMVKKEEDALKRSVLPLDEKGEIIEDSSELYKNKGYIAGLNALEMINLYNHL